MSVEKIDYKIVYSKKRKKTISLTIDSELGIRVSAPINVTREQIDAFVKIKKPWIDRKLEKIQKLAVETRNKQYLDGEKYLYKGKSYILKVEKGLQENVVLTEKHIIIINPRLHNPFSTKTIISLWYKRNAHQHIERRTIDLFNEFNVYSLRTPRVGFKEMKHKWGECRSDGIINFNRTLIKMPLACIDYVIMHELCHLVEMNHSKRFYALLDEHMPGWKLHKRELDRLGLAVL